VKDELVAESTEKFERWTIGAIRDALIAKRVSARGLAEDYFARIARENPKLNAFLALSPERAFAQAARVDAMVASGEVLPALAGVPIAIKDVISTHGVTTTCGSHILENYVPAYDATAVALLESAGAVMLGKTNCDEFAMGSSNENSAYGPVHNPVALDRVPGGSSGGSAAAVAAGLAVAALGTDTGGSIRQPGGFCGIPALMPTYGRVSRYGLIALASSLDRIGPFTTTVRDAAEVMNVISGRDLNDATSADTEVPDYTAALGESVEGLRIGIPREYFGPGMDPAVRHNIEVGIGALEKLGCKTVELDMPHTGYAIAVYYILMTAEASSNLARFDGVRYGPRDVGDGTLMGMYRATRGHKFGDEVKRRIVLGTYVLSAGYYDAYYRKAQQVRALITRDFEDAFKKVDLIVTPTSPAPAFKLGEKTDDPLAMYLADIYTVTGNLSGMTAISVPCGLTPEGLPVGLQIFGPHFGEARVLQLAHAFEQTTNVN
jgi:aspartyl-tRNA(Asn)/glutamyl-tRNA(Gln) amidotransferase subunit A